MSKVSEFVNSMPDKRNAFALLQAFDKIAGRGLVNATGTNQATAALLPYAINIVDDANGTKAVRLPIPQPDDPGVWVINIDASVLNVYPAVDGQINAVGVDTVYELAASQAAYFQPYSKIQWYTGIVGATSAQIAYLTGAVAGAAAASKVLVLDADKKIGDIVSMNVLGLGSVASNQALGVTALDANTSGARNTAVGIGAASAVTTGNDVTAFGNDALLVNTGSGNTAVGAQALDANVAGVRNTAVGFAAGGAQAASTDNDNVFVGHNAGLLANGSASGGNTIVGSTAFNAATTAIDCTAVGFNAAGANVT